LVGLKWGYPTQKVYKVLLNSLVYLTAYLNIDYQIYYIIFQLSSISNSLYITLFCYQWSS